MAYTHPGPVVPKKTRASKMHISTATASVDEVKGDGQNRARAVRKVSGRNVRPIVSEYNILYV